MLLGAWSLGFGLGNLDGWDGDYTVYLLSAGFFYYNDLNLILLNSHTGELALCFFFLGLSTGWKSSIVAGIC